MGIVSDTGDSSIRVLRIFACIPVRMSGTVSLSPELSAESEFFSSLRFAAATPLGLGMIVLDDEFLPKVVSVE